MTAGFLVVDKPAGITSHDVVSVLRAVLGIKKIGHTGTLDPFATGVLPMAIGHATRLIQFLDEDVKVYEGTVRLGQKTDTADVDGEVVEEKPIPRLTEASVHKVLSRFLGFQNQVPPAYSAVKVDGKALYKYAREGKSVKAAGRTIRIDSIDVLELTDTTIDIRVQCGPGTYVRTLGEDIAEALGTCGHLTSLRRTQSGPFIIDDSLDFETLSKEVAGIDDWRAALRPPKGAERVPWKDRAEVLTAISARFVGLSQALSHLPVVELNAHAQRRLRLRGIVEEIPPEVADGGHWRVTVGGQMTGIMKRDGALGRVARMLPDMR